MSFKTGHLRWLLALLAAFALFGAACSSDSDSSSDSASDTSDAATDSGGSGEGGATGEIVISGSSTVEPITSLVAEEFGADNDVTISVDGPGTGDGFELFCNGETDISDASRPIKDEEAAICAENGVEYTELRVGIDGLSVLTNPADDVECIDFAGIYALVGPESTGFSTWADATPLADEMGSEYGDTFPDAPLDITGPGEESGTYDTFVEFIVDPFAEDRGLGDDEIATRPDYTSSPNDNVIIDGITGSDSSFGWVGYAFYVNNVDQVKSIAVADPESGDCVEPTDETIASGDYPLSRDLFIYVNDAKAAENDALTQFVDFYLSDTGYQAVTDAGYVQLTEDSWAETQAAFSG